MVRTDRATKDWRGRLEEVGTDYIVVKGKTIPLDQIAGIGGVRKGNVAGMVGGSFLIGVGLVWSSLGYLWFAQGVIDGDGLFLGGGTIDMAIGSGITAVGAYPFYRRKRRFHRGDGWVYSTR